MTVNKYKLAMLIGIFNLIAWFGSELSNYSTAQHIGVIVICGGVGMFAAWLMPNE